MATRRRLKRISYRAWRSLKYRHISRLTVFFGLVLLILGISAGPILAQGKSSFSSQTPDAVKFTPPPPPNIPDPCKAAWGQISKKVSRKSYGNSYFSVSPEKLFKSRCKKYKDDLVAQFTKPIDDAKSRIDDAKNRILKLPETAKNRAEQELKSGFYAFAAEEMRKRLPPEERAKYSDLNDPATRAKVQKWAADNKDEFNTYADAYMSQNFPKVTGAYNTYVDLTSGPSSQIINDLSQIYNNAKQTLSKLQQLHKDAPKLKPAEYADRMAKLGLGGKVLDKFRELESGFRNSKSGATFLRAMPIIESAMNSKIERDKIGALLAITELIASEYSGPDDFANNPLMALLAEMVEQLAKVSHEVFQQAVSLESLLAASDQYCIGTGSHNVNQHTDQLKASQVLKNRGITACPLAVTRSPWKHIYQQTENNGQLHFWTGSEFIDGNDSGGGKPAAQEAVKFASKARDVGYKVPKGMKGYAGIYNVKGGLLPLLGKSREVISGIRSTLSSLTKATFKGGKCSRDKVLDHLETMTGLDVKNFAKEIEDKGPDRLITTYAASFIASDKGFGKSGSARANAYKIYDDIWAKLQNMQFRFVSGEVRNINKPSAPCPECAGAILDVRLSSGEEVRSCETWKADNSSNFSLYVLSQGASSLTVSAEVKGAKSDAYPAQGNFVRVLVKAGDGEEKTAECEAARQKLANARSNAARGYILAAESYLKLAKQHNCPEAADDIAQVQGEIDQRNADNTALAQAAANSCDAGKIDEAIATLSVAPNKNSKTHIANLEKLRGVLNTGNGDLEASREALRAGNIDGAQAALDKLDQKLQSISGFAACPDMNTALASARSALERLQQVLAEADQSMARCSRDDMARMIARFEKMDAANPAISQKLTALRSTQSALDNARQAYREAKAAYDAGDSAGAMSKLDAAESALNAAGSSSCQNIRDRIARARGKAQELADLKNDAQGAMASCSMSEIQRLINLATDKNLPIAEKLKIRLVTLKTVKSSFDKADAQYRKGNLSAALAHLDKTQNVLPYLSEGGNCPSISNRVNSARSGVADLINTIEGAEQAMRNCNLSNLASWSDKLSAKRRNPRVSATLARLGKARKKCEREERERQQTAAHDWCKNKYGGGYHASPVRSDGGYGCMPTQATANAWCNANNQGSGWVAVKIKHNGTHGCQLSRRAQRRNAVNYCKKRFGRAFVRVVWLKNGNYNCQYRTAARPRSPVCPQGYYYDNRTRRCHNAAAAIGQVLQGLQGLTGGNRGTRSTGCPPGTHYSPQLRRCHRDSNSRSTYTPRRNTNCPRNYYYNTDKRRCLPLNNRRKRCEDYADSYINPKTGKCTIRVRLR